MPGEEPFRTGPGRKKARRQSRRAGRAERTQTLRMMPMGVAIVDINDLGANILGFSEKEPSMDQIAKILGDNPLGQSSESTPMGIIRKV